MIKIANNLQAMIKASQGDKPYAGDMAEDFEIDYFPGPELLALGLGKRPNASSVKPYRAATPSFAQADINESAASAASTGSSGSSILDNKNLFHLDSSGKLQLRYSPYAHYSLRPDGTAMRRSSSLPQNDIQELLIRRGLSYPDHTPMASSVVDPNISQVQRPFSQTHNSALAETGRPNITLNPGFGPIKAQIDATNEIMGGPLDKIDAGLTDMWLDPKSIPADAYLRPEGEERRMGFRRSQTNSPDLAEALRQANARGNLENFISPISASYGLGDPQSAYRGVGSSLGSPEEDVLQGDDRFRPEVQYRSRFPNPQIGVPIVLPPELDPYVSPSDKSNLSWYIDQTTGGPVISTQGRPRSSIFYLNSDEDDFLRSSQPIPPNLIQPGSSRNSGIMQIADNTKPTAGVSVDWQTLQDPSLSDVDRRILQATLEHAERTNTPSIITPKTPSKVDLIIDLIRRGLLRRR
jgi:hypothetical protein